MLAPYAEGRAFPLDAECNPRFLVSTVEEEQILHEPRSRLASFVCEHQVRDSLVEESQPGTGLPCRVIEREHRLAAVQEEERGPLLVRRIDERDGAMANFEPPG